MDTKMKYGLRQIIFQVGFILLISPLLFSQQDTIRIACVGNSITDGNAMASKSDSYPMALGRYLGAGYNVINCGKSGTTMLKNGDYSYWNEQLFDDAINFNPNIVTIMLGTNDSKPQNWDLHKDEFITDYLAMIDTFKNRPANPEIYICLPLPSFSDAFSIRDSVIDAEIIPMIRQVADSAKVNLLDFNTPFLDKSYLMPDGIHPLIEGSDLIARIFLKELTGRTIESLVENNVALNKPAFQAGNNLPELTDGDTTTSIVFSSTSEPVIISLIDESNIDMIQINFTDFSLSALSFTLALSTDSLEWTTVVDTSITKTLLVNEGTISKFAPVFQSTQAKFIRFQINEGGIPTDSTIKANEIKVFETRAVHASLWGWELVSKSTKSIRVKIYTTRTSNIDEYVKVYRQTSNTSPFSIYSNYGSATPLSVTYTIQTGALNRSYSVVYYNGFEITSDTLTVINPSTTDVEGSLEKYVPQEYTLSQNYPNPFNPETNISFSIPSQSYVTLKVFDPLGREVATLVSEELPEGDYTRQWNAMNISSGIYFYRLQAGSFIETKKLILLR
jgi:lysophospholipase L1-like esterase